MDKPPYVVTHTTSGIYILIIFLGTCPLTNKKQLKKTERKASSSKTSNPIIHQNNDLPKEAFFNPVVTNLSETEEKNPDILKGLSEEAEVSSSTNDNHLKTQELQKRQKLLEEENKVKRQLLTKAIADRRQKTTEESKKLQQIQNELQKMDQLVANDVRFLRNTIEEASFEYNDAQ